MCRLRSPARRKSRRLIDDPRPCGFCRNGRLCDELREVYTDLTQRGTNYRSTIRGEFRFSEMRQALTSYSRGPGACFALVYVADALVSAAIRNEAAKVAVAERTRSLRSRVFRAAQIRGLSHTDGEPSNVASRFPEKNGVGPRLLVSLGRRRGSTVSRPAAVEICRCYRESLGLCAGIEDGNSRRLLPDSRTF